MCESPPDSLVNLFWRFAGEKKEGSPKPPNESASFTPASVSTATGERVSGGPDRTNFFSQVSGAARAPARMTGILAAASSFATYSRLRLMKDWDEMAYGWSIGCTEQH